MTEGNLKEVLRGAHAITRTLRQHDMRLKNIATAFVRRVDHRSNELAPVDSLVGGMKNSRPSQRFALAAIVVLAFVTLGLSVPIFVGGRPQAIVLHHSSVHAASRDTFVVTTPIRLSASPGLVLQRGTLTLVSDRSRPPLSGEAAAALLASGSARLMLEDATLTVEVDRPTDVVGAGTEPDAPAAPLLAALSRLGFSTLAIRRGIVVLKRHAGGSELLSDVRLDITNKRDVALTANGSFELQGRQLALDATVGFASDRKDVVRLPVKGSIKGSFLEATIADGRLVLGDRLQLVAGQAEVQSIGLRQVAAWLGAPWPGERGLGGFRAKGQLEWQDRTIAFQNASFQMDGNEATGTLTLDWGKARPSIEGTLALKTCDLTKYTGTVKPSGGFMERTGLGWLRSITEPGSLAFPLIRHLDADLRISANEVTSGALKFGKSAASVAVKDGKLLADVAELDIDGEGNLRGLLAIDMAGIVPRYQMRGKLEAVEAGKATEIMFGHPVLSGRASIMFDLTGTGETVDQLASTLHGKLGVELPEGGALGLDVVQLASLAARSPEIKGWGTLGRSQARVSRLVSRFSMQGGVLFADTFKATAGDRLMTLSGDINLASRTVDAQMSVARLTSSGPLAEVSASEPTEILSVRGPWSEPVVRYSKRPSKAAAPSPPPAGPIIVR